MCDSHNFSGLADMDFVYFKVLKTSKQDNFEKKSMHILVCTLNSTLLAHPQVASLGLSTAISVLTVLFCSFSLYCSVWWILDNFALLLLLLESM